MKKTQVSTHETSRKLVIHTSNIDISYFIDWKGNGRNGYAFVILELADLLRNTLGMNKDIRVEMKRVCGMQEMLLTPSSFLTSVYCTIEGSLSLSYLLLGCWFSMKYGDGVKRQIS